MFQNLIQDIIHHQDTAWSKFNPTLLRLKVGNIGMIFHQITINLLKTLIIENENTPPLCDMVEIQ